MIINLQFSALFLGINLENPRVFGPILNPFAPYNMANHSSR